MVFSTFFLVLTLLFTATVDATYLPQDIVDISHEAAFLNEAVVCLITQQVLQVAVILNVPVPAFVCGAPAVVSSTSSSTSESSSTTPSSTTTSSSSVLIASSSATTSYITYSSISLPTCTNAVEPSSQFKRRRNIIARQDRTTAYLPNIVSAASNTICQSTCQPFENAITACVNKFSTNTALAQCSCEAMFLSQLQTCGKCEDTLNNKGYGNGNYTGYCEQCVTVGLQPPNFPCNTPLEPQVSGSYLPMPSSTSSPVTLTQSSIVSAPGATPVPFPTCLVPSCPNGSGVNYATNKCSVCPSGQYSMNTTDPNTGLVSTRCVYV